MDIQAVQAIIQLGTSITTTGALLLAWMLERKRVDQERQRSDRLESTLIRTLETRLAKEESG